MEYKEAELSRLQEALYATLSEVDRICRKHGIRYFVTGGTAVGAYFWQKILPWDDDVDVGMMRPDYERFAAIAGAELGDRFFLQTPDTEPHTPFYFMKIRMNGSRFSESTFQHIKMHQGIYVDIFPFDKLQLPLQRLKLQSYAYTLYRNGNGSESALRKIRSLTRFNRHISFPILRCLSRLTGGKTLTYDFGIPFHIVYDEKDIFPLATHEFEGIRLSVPGNSHHMLQSQFGDYMRLPNLDHVEHHVEKLEFFDEKTEITE